MSYKILKPIQHGIYEEVFLLKPGQIVEDDFFTPPQIDRLLKNKGDGPTITFVKEEGETPESDRKIIQIKDIREMTVVEAKELINDEIDLTRLEKYKDMETNRGEDSRVTLLRFINDRIKDITGIE